MWDRLIGVAFFLVYVIGTSLLLLAAWRELDRIHRIINDPLVTCFQ